MAYIAKKGGWQPNQVPEGPIELIWAHPLSYGLVGFWPLNASLVDLVAGNNLAVNANGNFAVGAVGTALSRAVTTDAGNMAIIAPFTGSGAFSAFAQFSTRSVTGNFTNYLCRFGGTTGGTEFTLAVIGGKLVFNEPFVTSNAATFNDGAVHGWGLTKPAGATQLGVNLFGDGALLPVTTGGSTQTINFASTNPLSVGVNPSLAGSGFVGTISGLRFYSRVLTPAEMQWLAAEPWIMVRPRSPRRIYSLPPASGVSGSAAITEAADTIAAVGALIVAGTAAANEAADVVTGVGAEGVTGTAAVAEASDIVAATGAQAVAGTAAVSEAADAVSATGAESVAGSAAISESADAVSATGSAGGGGVAAIVEPADAVSASGGQSVTGSGTVTEAADVVSATGAQAVAGTAAVAESIDQVAGAGAQGVSGTAAIVESPDSVIATGTAGSPAVLVGDPAYVVGLGPRSFTVRLASRRFAATLGPRSFTVH